MRVYKKFKFLTSVMILQSSMIAEAAGDSHEGYNNTFNACNEILNDADLSIDTVIVTTTGKAVSYDKYSIDRDMMTGVVDDGEEEDTVLAELPYVDVKESNYFVLHSDIYSVEGILERDDNAKSNGIFARDRINTYFSTIPDVVTLSLSTAAGVAGAITYRNIVISSICAAVSVACSIYVYVQKKLKECGLLTTTYGSTNYQVSICTTKKSCDVTAMGDAVEFGLSWARKDDFHKMATSGSTLLNHGGSGMCVYCSM